MDNVIILKISFEKIFVIIPVTHNGRLGRPAVVVPVSLVAGRAELLK